MKMMSILIWLPIFDNKKLVESDVHAGSNKIFDYGLCKIFF